MQNYQNSGGNSGVYAYEIGPDYITVKFSGNQKLYTYSYNGGAGRENVENMKELAEKGSGLNSYINKYVKDLYDR